MTDATFRATMASPGHKLRAAFEGFPDAGLDTRLTPQSMTPRQIAEHLCDCYLAFEDALQGKKHEWGAYKAKGSSSEELLQEMMSLRGAAVEKALASTEVKHKLEALEYIPLHDEYHIGQLCLLRLEADPEWKFDSIYAHLM